MILVSFTDCCLRLGIDPKTLRLWLKAANLSSCLHPTDARLTCLTLPQIQQLAALHSRCLSPLPATALDPASVLSSSPQASPPPTGAGSSPGSAHADDADLRYQLLLLHAHVATLQTQVTELALALLRGGFAPPHASATSFPTPLPAPTTPPPATCTAPSEQQRPRARSRVLPLIEVCADGSLVAISPTDGVLSLVPDSPEWFTWLSSLTTFAFQGQQGCFSATRTFRDSQRIQSWNVHHSLHGRSCTLSLGLTPALTHARLEEMAATVHARLTTL